MDSKLSPEADQGIDEILYYLAGEFGANFTSQYFDDYLHIRQVLEKLPFGFPVASEIKKVRKLVFRKRTTI